MELFRNGLLDPHLNEQLDLKDLNNLPYISAVIKEVLRVAPPVGAGYRKALKTFDLDVSSCQSLITRFSHFDSQS